MAPLDFGVNLALSASAHAQQSNGAAATAKAVALDKVEINGRRISLKQSQLAGVGPVTVIDSASIQRSGAISAETLLQRLLASAGTAGSQTSAYWTSNGYSTTQVNLRGLGINRTLVLLNGRRVSIREVSRRTGLSRNTVRQWLRQGGVTEPQYPKRASTSAVDAWAEHLATALKADQQRAVPERRTVKMLFEQIRALGYAGSYSRVTRWVRAWRTEQDGAPRRAAFAPMSFALGDAFQFDWSCEYVFVGGLRRRLRYPAARCR